MTGPIDALEPSDLYAYQSGLPEWWIDTIHIVRADSIDDRGRRWTVDKNPDGEKGWSSSPAPRMARTDRPFAHGEFRSTAYRKGRSVTLAGSVYCPDVATREATELELAGLCSDPGRLYTYRRRTDSYDMTIDVEIEDEPLVATTTMWRVDWSYQFSAPDPRKHAFGWQEPISTILAGSTGGVDYSGSSGFGIDFNGSTGFGIDWGAPGRATSAYVVNHGTAPAKPLFTLTGPVDQPTIIDTDAGLSISYAGNVASGEVVTINCDDFAQQGFMPLSCWSSRRGNVRSLLPFMTDWPTVDPRTARRYQLVGAGSDQASLKVSLRSAWW